MDITIYNTETKDVLRTISGPKEMVLANVQEGESFIEGHYPKAIKVVNGEAVEKTLLYPEYPTDRPLDLIKYAHNNEALRKAACNLIGFEDELEITQVLQKYYKILRKKAYPKIENYIDAQVKINSGDADLIQEGREQEAEYFQQCLAIKNKFAKG